MRRGKAKIKSTETSSCSRGEPGRRNFKRLGHGLDAVGNDIGWELFLLEQGAEAKTS